MRQVGWDVSSDVRILGSKVMWTYHGASKHPTKSHEGVSIQELVVCRSLRQFQEFGSNNCFVTKGGGSTHYKTIIMEDLSPTLGSIRNVFNCTIYRLLVKEDLSGSIAGHEHLSHELSKGLVDVGSVTWSCTPLPIHNLRNAKGK